MEIYWQGKYSIDAGLPFGLHSSSYQLTDALHWILQHNYDVQYLLHYLDDFFTAGHANSPICANYLSKMLTLCKNVNAPLKLEKIEGPTTCLTFIGIQIDTNTMQASIPTEKKQILLDTLHSFQKRSKCTKRKLLSLVGKLSFACKVVPAGRIFLRRLIDLHRHLHLNKNAKLDIK